MNNDINQAHARLTDQARRMVNSAQEQGTWPFSGRYPSYAYEPATTRRLHPDRRAARTPGPSRPISAGVDMLATRRGGVFVIDACATTRKRSQRRQRGRMLVSGTIAGVVGDGLPIPVDERGHVPAFEWWPNAGPKKDRVAQRQSDECKKQRAFDAACRTGEGVLPLRGAT